MSDLTQKLSKLRKSFEELRKRHGAAQCVWQIVRKDSDFLRSANDFSPTDYHRKPIKLPDDEAETIRLLNQGEVLLLNGVLRLFIVPDGMKIERVERLFAALTRRHGTDHEALYKEAARILNRGD